MVKRVVNKAMEDILRQLLVGQKQLAEHFDLIDQQLGTLTEGQASINDRLDNLQDDILSLSSDVSNLKGDVLAIRKDTTTLKKDTSSIKKDLRYAWEDIQKLDKRVHVNESLIAK